MKPELPDGEPFKLCIDCKYCDSTTYGSYGDKIKYHCRHPRVSTHIVDGRLKHVACAQTRSEHGDCGLAARLFEFKVGAKEEHLKRAINRRTCDEPLFA